MQYKKKSTLKKVDNKLRWSIKKQIWWPNARARKRDVSEINCSLYRRNQLSCVLECIKIKNPINGVCCLDLFDLVCHVYIQLRKDYSRQTILWTKVALAHAHAHTFDNIFYYSVFVMLLIVCSVQWFRHVIWSYLAFCI